MPQKYLSAKETDYWGTNMRKIGYNYICLWKIWERTYENIILNPLNGCCRSEGTSLLQQPLSIDVSSIITYKIVKQHTSKFQNDEYENFNIIVVAKSEILSKPGAER